eukprot:751776_1
MNTLVILWLFVFLSISGAAPCDVFIGDKCTAEADCCDGPEGTQDCKLGYCCGRDTGRDKARCPKGNECCDGFECVDGECTKAGGGGGDCVLPGKSCVDQANCCDPDGHECQSELCCGLERSDCRSDSECCDDLECVSNSCTVNGGGNAVPFNDNASKWVERDPFMYIYILTWAVFVTFICSVPCAWCYLMDRYNNGLFQRKQKYGKVVNEHDDV